MLLQVERKQLVTGIVLIRLSEGLWMFYVLCTAEVRLSVLFIYESRRFILCLIYSDITGKFYRPSANQIHII